LSGEGTTAILDGWARIIAMPAADCSTVEAATRAVLALDKQRQLLGIEEPVATTERMGQLFDRYWEVCFPVKVALCKSTGDVYQLATFGLQYDRQRQLHWLLGEAQADARTFELRKAMEDCGRFKLSATSKGTWKDTADIHGDVDFKAAVQIRVEFRSSADLYFDLLGRGPATEVNVTYFDKACWKFESFRQDAMMEAKMTDMVFQPETHAPLRVTLTLRPPKLVAVTTCTSKKRGTKTMDSPVSDNTWAIAHKAHRKGKFYELKTMKAGTYPRIFNYVWDGKGSEWGTTSSDSTELLLEHLPS